jgi:hypothetical protein
MAMSIYTKGFSSGEKTRELFIKHTENKRNKFDKTPDHPKLNKDI